MVLVLLALFFLFLLFPASPSPSLPPSLPLSLSFSLTLCCALSWFCLTYAFLCVGKCYGQVFTTDTVYDLLCYFIRQIHTKGVLVLVQFHRHFSAVTPLWRLWDAFMTSHWRHHLLLPRNDIPMTSQWLPIGVQITPLWCPIRWHLYDAFMTPLWRLIGVQMTSMRRSNRLLLVSYCHDAFVTPLWRPIDITWFSIVMTSQWRLIDVPMTSMWCPNSLLLAS